MLAETIEFGTYGVAVAMYVTVYKIFPITLSTKDLQRWRYKLLRQGVTMFIIP